MKLDTVYGRRERHLFSSIGRYAIGGTGINFGFFYLAIFNGDHTDMSADVIGGEVYAADDRRGPVIDPLLTAGLARLRYNWFVRGTVLLVDFDTREIKGDFLPTIRWVSEQVPTLCGAFTDDN